MGGGDGGRNRRRSDILRCGITMSGTRCGGLSSAGHAGLRLLRTPISTALGALFGDLPTLEAESKDIGGGSSATGDGVRLSSPFWRCKPNVTRFDAVVL